MHQQKICNEYDQICMPYFNIQNRCNINIQWTRVLYCLVIKRNKNIIQLFHISADLVMSSRVSYQCSHAMH